MVAPFGISRGRAGHLLAVRAALRVPAYLESGQWQSLLRPDSTSNRAVAHIPRERLIQLFRTAELTLRVLARLPGGRWKATCLYRSIAAALMLRAAGVPCRLCIGATGGQAVVAHAWVENYDGIVIYEDRATYRELV
jgi:hypothetical protein